MNQRANKYITDLHSYIEGIPYGDVDIRIRRVKNKTVQIETVAEETLRYVDNEEAKTDMLKLIDKLIEAGFSGEAHIKLDMKAGQINILGIFDKKETTY